GFGEYGFPESHAASFAILVYVSSWVKWYFPEVFAAALLNAQPMGFYAPAQLVRDAREHEVEVRPPDINASDWDCTLEPSSPPPSAGEVSASSRTEGGGSITHAPLRHRMTATPPPKTGEEKRRCALRLGFRQVAGLSEKTMKLMVERRTTPYRDPADLWRRGGLTKRQILALARADAFASLGLSRRDVLWAVRAFSDAPLPLLDHQPRPRDLEPAVTLPSLTLGEQVVDDYATIAMSLRSHPLALLRPMLSERRVSRTDALLDSRNGDRFVLAGLVLVRQRPGTASGVVFVTIEDEGRAPAGRQWSRAARGAGDPSRGRGAVGLVRRARPHLRPRRAQGAAQPRRPGAHRSRRPSPGPRGQRHAPPRRQGPAAAEAAL
ncbi:MAG: hypothetical protein NTV97_14515, partial [Alphaproteobacteria bacterium]|nr:hypothetical protein [Alphaproteobacteria bacterium]